MPTPELKFSGEMTAEQIHAAASLVKAYREPADRLGNFGLWLFFTVIALLAFRCNGVTLWELEPRDCPPAVEVTP